MSPAPRVYKGRAGQWAFVSHRVTGFLVFFFLLLHIVDVSLISRPHLYDEVHALYGNVFLRLFECGLLFALLFHALNGLRIVVIDFFAEGARYQRGMFHAVVLVTLAAGVPGSYVILKPWIDGNL